MQKIQANLSGTRSINVEDIHLQTLLRYKLLDNLVDKRARQVEIQHPFPTQFRCWQGQGIAQSVS